MQFFNNQELRIYTANIITKIKDEVSKISDDDIRESDIQEWTEYMVEKYKVWPITVFEDSISQTLIETKVEQYDFFSRDIPCGKNVFEVDGYRIVFLIPFDGDGELLFLQPSTYILSSFHVSNYNKPHGDQCGDFSLSLSYTRSQLENIGEDVQTYVNSQFENLFKSFRKMIEYVNADVESFNDTLPNIIKKQLESRREKAESFATLSKLLEIPLVKSDIAPNSIPVPLKRVSRTPAKRPQRKRELTEYSISDEDYKNINNIIIMAGTTMEKTARTYHRNNEEELRDHLLASLNTHYDNATGETFRKIGKTDICIEFENKAAFIGECKIWQGETTFDKAVQQLMNYSTWRDGKVSLVVFNKNNKSFNSIIEKIDSWAKRNVKKHNRLKHNVWECEFYRVDMETLVKLNIVAFDLYVDKTKFKDNRYKDVTK